jgi:hypothetical protein
MRDHDLAAATPLSARHVATDQRLIARLMGELDPRPLDATPFDANPAISAIPVDSNPTPTFIVADKARWRKRRRR